jgi:acetoin utilization protein AcuB
MLVKDFMTPNPDVVTPDITVPEAAQIMKKGGFRRLPVVKEGRVVGIVTDRDLKEAMPSDANSLSIWELNYLISKLTVGEIMTRDPITVSDTLPLQAAAKLMLEHKVGGLPVVHEGRLVGIVTITDVLKAFLQREAELLVGAETNPQG